MKAADVYGVSILDVKNVTFSFLGLGQSADHRLAFSNQDGLTLCPKEYRRGTANCLATTCSDYRCDIVHKQPNQ